MAKTPSNMVPLGTQAPDFNLIDTVSGKSLRLLDLKSKTATVIMFICNHCPFVIHIIDELVKTAKYYHDKDINFIAISSNDIENYPDDSPELMTAFAQKHNFNFPYLYDEEQEVAKAYDAACTPDFYVFDHLLHLVYRGQFDGATPGNDIPVTGESLNHALDNILAGKKISDLQKPSLGCNIKWKK